MNTLLCVLSCLLTLAISSPSPTWFDLTFSAEWDAFKQEYNKTYESDEVENLRKFIFAENKKEIDDHNELYARGFTTYSKSVNQFTDLLKIEFAAQYFGYNSSTSREDSKSSNSSLDSSDYDYDNYHEFTPDLEVPTSVDWRKAHVVTRVKDQGRCGSCWAFSAIGAIEGLAAITHKKLIELSVQQLVDCVYPPGRSGCRGGRMIDAFKYIIEAGGISSEAHYPYISGETGTSAKCKFNKKDFKVKLKGYHIIPADENSLRDAVAAIGPISVAINGYGIMDYSQGIYDNPNCDGQRLNHAMLLIGYGIEKDIPYWLVKNSWGAQWGEKGYIRMRRNRNNLCGIASAASHPEIQQNSEEEEEEENLIN
uniref:Cathepsin L n=2 Tax=Lygus hesperus TaxID=30085 RepID=A0A146LJL8_LYGHE